MNDQRIKTGVGPLKKFGCSLYDHILLFLCPHKFISIHITLMLLKGGGNCHVPRVLFLLGNEGGDGMGNLAAGKIIATLVYQCYRMFLIGTYPVHICVCMRIYTHACGW